MDTIKLIYKRYFSHSIYRKLYNFTFFSWKCLLFINFSFMIIFFLLFDSNKPSIQLIQVILSGIFISIITYIVTIVYPERNRVKRILEMFEVDLFRDLHSALLEIKHNRNNINFLVEDIVFTKINTLENNLGLITREVGINRCVDNRSGLLTHTYFIKKELKKLTNLCKDYNENKIEIIKNIERIKKVYRDEVISMCKEIKKYYFLNWKNIIKINPNKKGVKMKLNKKMIIMTIILFPFIINWAFSVLEYIPGIMIGDEKTWISFLGGYVGAIITLGGVWWQIGEYRKQEVEREIKLREKEEEKTFRKTQTLYSILIYEIGSLEGALQNIITEVKITEPTGNMHSLKSHFSQKFKDDEYNLKNFEINNFYEILSTVEITEQHRLLHNYSKTKGYINAMNNAFVISEKDPDIKTIESYLSIFEKCHSNLKGKREDLEGKLKKYQG